MVQKDGKYNMIRTIVKYLRYYIYSKNNIIIDKNLLFLNRKRNIEILNSDYYRTSSLELVASEISKYNVYGNTAEVGVYRGDFAMLINKAFPDKKLYLFDTFNGFDEKDIDNEKYETGINASQDFSDTSVELVLNKMKYKKKIIIKPGWFPKSLNGLEELFCFVSLDADLYQPTKHGLNYFYPRLSHGGYIFIHDFNNDNYSGVRKAVTEFCNLNKIGYYPMSDRCGSVMLTK